MTPHYSDALQMLQVHLDHADAQQDARLRKSLRKLRETLLSRWAAENPSDFAYWKLVSGKTLNAKPDDKLAIYDSVTGRLRGEK